MLPHVVLADLGTVLKSTSLRVDRVGYLTDVSCASRRIKQTDASKLQDEYSKLVEGLQDNDEAEDNIVGAPGTVPRGDVM